MLKVVSIKIGQKLTLSALVRKVQEELVGHSFLAMSLEFHDERLTIVPLISEAYYAARLEDGDDIPAFAAAFDQLNVSKDSGMIVWFPHLPDRFEHMLQLLRAVFCGRGFEEIEVSVSMIMNTMAVGFSCQKAIPRTVIPNSTPNLSR